MESGSNKSLFTLIAVVIFGVFLSLSYWMFQDELTNVLASVMDKTSEMTNKKLDNNGRIPTDVKHFTYTSSNGEVTITRYSSSGPKEVIIPALINGLPVTKVGDGAFQNIALDSLILSDNIISVGTYAFTGCNLKSIDLGNSIEYLGHDSLAWNSLTYLDIPESLKFIGYATFHGNKFVELNIPETLDTLENCQGVAGVVPLDETMFSAIPTLKKVTIPNKFKSELVGLKMIKTYHWVTNPAPGILVVDSYWGSDLISYY